MKKISYFIFLVATMFIISSNIQALTCLYTDTGDYLEKEVTSVFTINYENNVSSAKISGNITVSEDFEKWKKGEKYELNIPSSTVSNWNNIYDSGDGTTISVKGQDYYRDNNTCPPYSAFVVWNSGNQYKKSFIVFTDQYRNDVETFVKGKPINVIMKLTEAGYNESLINSCAEIHTNEGNPSCEHNSYFSCVWNETEYGNYCNTDNLRYVNCGKAFDIPYQIPKIVNFAFNLLKIGTPIILIIISIIQLLKALASSKDDEIKKSQSSLVKKIIAAVLIFFISSIVQFVISIAADSGETEDVSTCMNCFLNNSCSENIYYKTNVGGTYLCTYLAGDKKGKSEPCKGNK